MSIESEEFMQAALLEGKKALPLCLPNPPVGCVLVKAGSIIARGHTQPPRLLLQAGGLDVSVGLLECEPIADLSPYLRLNG